MATYCSHHRTVRLGGDQGVECPVCLGDEWLRSHFHREVNFDHIADAWVNWLTDQQACDDPDQTEALIEMLHANPLFEFLLFVDREMMTSVKIPKCPRCQVLTADPQGVRWEIEHKRCKYCAILGYQEKRGAA